MKSKILLFTSLTVCLLFFSFITAKATGPRFVFTQPAAGMQFTAGQPYYISINNNESSLTMDACIYLSTDSGATWSRCANVYSFFAGNSDYYWAIDPFTAASAKCKLAISDYNSYDPNWIYYNESDLFEILAAPPSLFVGVPAFGDFWQSGTHHYIGWMSVYVNQNVNLEYSTDGGNSWESIATAVSSPNGYNVYDWTVPGVSGLQNNSFVRITSEDGTLSDTTKAFTLSETPRLAFTQPVPGTQWTAGQLYNITINNQGPSIDYLDAKIYLSTDGGSTWNPLMSLLNLFAGQNNFNWAIDPLTVASANCKLAISPSYGYDPNWEYYTESETFEILAAPPSLLISQPYPYAFWQSGTNHNIEWMNVNVNQNVNLEYSTDNGNTWELIAGGISPVNGINYFDWVVPGISGIDSLSQVRITSEDGTLSNTSNVFTISEFPRLIFTEPLTGAQWIAGQSYNVIVNNQGAFMSNVRLYLSYDGGITWNTSMNIGNLNAGTNTFSWAVDPITQASPGCKFAVSPFSGYDANWEYYAESEAFEILAAPPSINVNFPNADSFWKSGTRHNIEWQSINVNQNESLEYSTDSGNTWTLIAAGITPSNGNNVYDWTIPYVSGVQSNSFVRIFSEDGTLGDTSSVFALSETPQFIFTEPTAGMQLTAGQPYNFTINNQGTYSNIWDRIYLSTDGGVTWNFLMYAWGLSVGPNNFNWIIDPLTVASANCKLAISDYYNGYDPNWEYYSESDTFEILPAPPSITVHQPNAGAFWQSGTHRNLEWTSINVNQNISLDYSTDGGENWTQIATGITPSNGGNTFDWTVTDVIGIQSNSLVRITSEDGTLGDTSNVFTISETPQFAFTRPINGDQWTAGQSYDIMINNQGPDMNWVGIYLTLDGGATWNLLMNVYALNTGPNTFSWLIDPITAASADCKLAISNYWGYDPNWQSYTESQTFEIQAAPPGITVNQPAMGAVWQSGMHHTIEWMSVNLGQNVNLEYSTDGGFVWNPIATGIASGNDNNMFDWTIPDVGGIQNSSFVRVITEDGTLTGVSNVFTIEQYCIPDASTWACGYMWIGNVKTTGGISDFDNTTGCSGSSYSDFSGSAIASNLQTAGTVMSFTSIGNPMSYSVWIDYNDNDVFETEERVIANDNSGGAMTFTDYFTIPLTAAPGTHIMRVRGEYNSIGAPYDPCNKLDYGETEDYAFTVIAALPCIGIPDPGNTVCSSRTACSGDLFTLSLQNSVAAFGTTYQWQSSTDNNNWSEISGATNALLMTSQTELNYYRCAVTCSEGPNTVTSNPVSVLPCYCIPPVSIEPCYYMGIGNVATSGGLTDFNNNTLCNGTSYSDYSGYAIASNSRLATTYMSFTSTGYPLSYSVWIDFNDNGFFDAEERVITNPNSERTMTVDGNFTIPLTASIGTHRMRVRGEYYYYGAPYDPCNQLSYGETQDYAFTVIAHTYDLQLSGFVNPPEGCGLTDNEKIEVIIRNAGTSDYTAGSGTVKYSIDISQQLADENINRNIASGDTIHYTFLAGANLSVNAFMHDTTYLIDSWIDYPGDENLSNDSITIASFSRLSPQVPVVSDIIIPYASSASLNATVLPNYFPIWYESVSSVDSLKLGNPLNTPVLYAPDTVYVAAKKGSLEYAIIGTDYNGSGQPYYSYYPDGRTQIIYSADEMRAAGFVQGDISSLAFNVYSRSATVLNGFNIKMQNTSLASLSSFVESGWTSVFSGTYTVPGSGWQDVNFQNPFVWDGVSNILINICFNNDGYGSETDVYCSYVPGKTWYGYSANSYGGCEIPSGYSQNYRSNIRFRGTKMGSECPSSRIPLHIGISDVPGRDVGVTSIITPNSGFEISDPVTVGVVIKNFGTSIVDTITVSYIKSGASVPVTEILYRSLASGDTLHYNFAQSANISTLGTYPFKAYTSLPGDIIYSNDTARRTVENFTYCNPSFSYGCNYAHINNFSVNTLVNNNSGCNGGPGSYIDYPENTFTTGLQKSVSYPFSITPRASYGQGFGVWIDLNHDGDFDDADEFLTSYYSSSPFSVNATIASTYAYTGKTRMRVRALYNNNLYSDNSCTNYNSTYGETEDYTITLLPEPSPIDIKLVSIDQPDNSSYQLIPTDVVVQVKNIGSETITELPLTYIFNNQTPVSYTWNGTLSPQGQLGIHLPQVTATVTDNDIKVYSDLSGDMDLTNDTLAKHYLALSPPALINYRPDTLSATITSCDSTAEQTLSFFIYNTGYQPLNYRILQTSGMTENFESGFDKWFTNGYWGLINQGYNGGYGLTESPSGNYGNNWNNYAELKDSLLISNKDSCKIQYMLKYAMESCCDRLYTQISVNRGSWITLYTSGSNGSESWNFKQIPFSSYVNNGDYIKFRFLFTADYSVVYDGVVIDNFTIKGLNGGSWATLSRTADTVAAGDSSIVNVTFRVGQLNTGMHTQIMTINSNDPFSPNLPLHLDLTVIGGPQIAVKDSVKTFPSVMAGASTTGIFKIYNTGCDSLKITAINYSDPAFSFVFPPFILPKDSSVLPVRFSSLIQGLHRDTFTIVSNSEIKHLYVSGTVLPTPQLILRPDSFLVNSGNCNDTINYNLLIKNNGNAPMNWNAYFSNGAGKALAFNGSNSEVQFGNLGQMPQKGSVEFWMKTNSNSVNCVLYSSSGVNDNWKGVNIYQSYNSLYLIIGNDAGGTYSSYLITGNIDYGKWHHVAVTWDITQNNIRTYFDGTLNTSAYNSYWNTSLSDVRLGIGYTSSYRFNGEIDELRIWSENRSASDIMNLYKKSFISPSPALTGLWEFNELSGDTVFSMNSGRKGILYNVSRVSSGAKIENTGIHVYPTHGILAEGDSSNIQVAFVTSGLNSGSHRSGIGVSSNDPLHPLVIVPTHLILTGSPQLQLLTTDLNLPGIMAGASATDSLKIVNTGCDTLKITAMNHTDAAFSPVFPQTVFPGDSSKIKVHFSSMIQGLHRDTFNIISNGDTKQLFVSGTILPKPELAVAPDSLFATVTVCNDSVILPFTVYNRGNGNLAYIFNKGFGLVGDTSVLVIQESAEWGVDMKNFIQTNFSKTATKISSAQIAATDFSLYDIIIVTGNQSSSYYNTVSTNKAKFEAFVNSGGILQYQLANYNGITVNLVGGVNASNGNNEIQNTVLLPTHPIVSGLPVTLQGNDASAGYLTSLPAGAKIITETKNSLKPTTIEYNYGNGVVIATTMTWGYLYSNGYNSGPMLPKATAYSMSKISAVPQWISMSSDSGTVVPGDSANIALTFRSRGLNSGIFNYAVVIKSNDPLHPSVTIPAHFIFDGSPHLQLSITNLTMNSIMAGASGSDSVKIINNGCDTLKITDITHNNSVFTLNRTTYTLLPRDSAKLKIAFNPVLVGIYHDTLHFISNAGFNELYVHAVALVAPVASVIPGSINDTLTVCNQSITRYLKIKNTGNDILTWSALMGGLGISDNFDNGINISNWSNVSNGISAASCGTAYGNNALYFNGGGTREVITKSLNTVGGGNISFYIKISGSGGSPCEQADFGEDVVLEYTLNNGSTWNTIQTFLAGSYTYFTRVQIPIPLASQSFNTCFRWRQLTHSGLGYDNWSIDEVNISTININNIVPSSGTVAVGDSATVQLILNGQGLINGIYLSPLVFHTNDPLHSVITVPVQLVIKANPEISVAENPLIMNTVMIGALSSKLLRVENTGCDSLKITNISHNLNQFVISPSSLIILPRDTASVHVTFTTANVGNYTDTIKLFSNAGNLRIPVKATAVGAPEIITLPDQITASLACDSSSIIPFKIKNPGIVPLNWNAFVSDQEKGALQFNGINNYVNTGNWSPGTKWTVEAWVKPTVLSLGNKLIAGSEYPYYPWGICMVDTKFAAVYRSAQSGYSQTLVADNFTVSAGIWYHVACSYNGSIIRLYINGQLVKSAIVNSNYTAYSYPVIGGDPGYGNYFSGSIDEVRIWNKVRSQSQISYAMNHILAGNESGLLGYWPFNKVSGTAVTDMSGNSHNGNISGATFTANTSPAIGWVNLSNTSGVIGTGDSVQINVSVNRHLLVQGTHPFKLIIQSDDPVKPFDTTIVSINAIYNLVPVDIGSDTNLCSGSALVVSAGSYSSYTWNDNSHNPAINVSGSGTYHVVVADIHACQFRDTIQVGFTQAPIADAGPDKSVCQNGSVSLNGSASGGTAPYQYIWRNEAHNVIANYANYYFTPAGSLMHFLSVVDNNGCTSATADTVIITVNLNPVVNAGRDTVVELGASVTLHGSVTGGTYPYTVSWYPPYQMSLSNTLDPVLTPTYNSNYTLSVSDANNCSATDNIYVSVKYTVSGKVVYNNTAQTPIQNVWVYLENTPNVVKDSVLASELGTFIFNQVDYGAHYVYAKPAALFGGVNSTDALGIRRHVVNLALLTGVNLIAADVNRSSTISSADALQVLRRTIGLMSTFISGDWVSERLAFNTYGANAQNLVIKTLCAGDVNGSYNIYNTKSEDGSPELKCVPSVTTLIAGEAFSIPLSVKQNIKPGAVTLYLQFPDNLIEVTGVTSDGSEVEFNAKNGVLSVGIYDEKGITLNDNILLSIQCNVRPDAPPQNVELSLLNHSEIADAEAKVLTGLTLEAPSMNIVEKFDGFIMNDNFPNPFSATTTIRLYVPEDASVRISILSSLGIEVKSIFSKKLSIGWHNIQVDAGDLAQGTYMYRLQAVGMKKSFEQTRRMMIIR